MSAQETVDVRQNIDKIRIFCAECCTTAKIVWRDEAPDTPFVSLLHIECHGEQRLVTLPHTVVRRADIQNRPHVDLFWSDLDFLSSGELDRIETDAETQMLKLGTLVEVVRRVRSVR